MVFREWGQSALKPDGCGIPAPCGDRDLSASDLFLMLVPALAVDRYGIRLGYGGGFYDRLFAQVSGLRLGVGFALQRVNDWESEAHDQRLDGFLSEEGLTLFE